MWKSFYINVFTNTNSFHVSNKFAHFLNYNSAAQIFFTCPFIFIGLKIYTWIISHRISDFKRPETYLTSITDQPGQYTTKTIPNGSLLIYAEYFGNVLQIDHILVKAFVSW